MGLSSNARCPSQAHWKALSGLPLSDEHFSLSVTAEALRVDSLLHIVKVCHQVITDIKRNSLEIAA